MRVPPLAAAAAGCETRAAIAAATAMADAAATARWNSTTDPSVGSPVSYPRVTAPGHFYVTAAHPG